MKLIYWSDVITDPIVNADISTTIERNVVTNMKEDGENSWKGMWKTNIIYDLQ